MSAPRWETHKENIQPRPRGRHAKLLEKVLVGSKDDIEAERIRRENAVKDAVVRNEPAKHLLDAYLDYALFIVDHYPAGSKHLVRAVEDPCRKHAKDEFFRDDIRFLRLWILYIEMRRDKLDVFSYMSRKRIGYSWTLFYEAWAATLEAARQYDEVEKVYKRAREVNSQPQDRILQRENEFQCRMAARKKRDQKKRIDAEAKKLDHAQREAARNERNTARTEASLASAILSAEASNEKNEKPQRIRPALGEISEREARTGVRPFSTHDSRSSTVSEQRKQSTQVQRQGPPNKENKFEIFSDRTDSRPKESREMGYEQDIPFEVLTKIDDVDKEDHGRLPSQWAGETLPQNDAAVQKLKKRGLSSRETSSFQIYQDENYQRGALSPGDQVLEKPSPPIANDENVPVLSPEAPRRDPSPKLSRKGERCNRPPSPTINTKIAMREIDDMFNCSLPMEQHLDAKFSLPPDPPLSVEDNKPRNPPPFQILQDDDLAEHSKLNDSNMIAPVHCSAQEANQFDEFEVQQYLKVWAVDQPSFQYVGEAHVDIEPESVVELPWRVPVTLCVQESQYEGFNKRSRVFFVEDIENEFGGAEIQVSSTGDEEDVPLFVLKQSDASNIWEFYIYQIIQQRFQKKLMQTDSIPLAVGFSHGRESSFLVLDTKGVACVSRILHIMPNNVLPESLAMFLTVDLLKTLCTLHSIDIIHADVTLDNVLFRRNTAVELTGDTYSADGDRGWSACGVLLVDYNNSVDVLHERFGGTGVDDVLRYTSTCNSSNFDEEYRPHPSRPWAYDVDCYGAAVCSAKMLGIELGNVDCGPVPLKHESVWKSFFNDVAQLEPLSTPAHTVEVMKRNYDAMERVLEGDRRLAFEVGKLFRVVAFSLEADGDTTRMN